MQKKLIAMLMVLTMITIPGCSKEQTETAKTSEAGLEKIGFNRNPDTFPIVNEKVTFELMGSKSPIQGPWDTLKFFKKMEEMTNVSFEYNTPPAETFNEQKNLMFASEEYPDVLFGANLTRAEEIAYGTQGILLPLEDLIETYCPNIQKMFETYPDVKKSVTAPDGHIYTLPHINEVFIGNYTTLWYNKQWLDALNVSEVPTTVEGTYDLLVRFRDEDPNQNGKQDDIPLSLTKDLGGLEDMFLPAYGILDDQIYVQDGTVKFGYLEAGYLEYAKLVRKMFEENLIDPDTFTQESTNISAKGHANTIGLAPTSLPSIIYDCDDLELQAQYQLVPALSSSYTNTRLSRLGTGIGTGVFSLTSKCSYPEVMMRWVDWLYSEEGSLYVHFGDENDLWKYTESGKRTFIQPADGRSTEEYRGGVLTPDCGTVLPKWVRTDTETNWEDPFQESRLSQLAEINALGKIVFPSVYFTAEEQSEIDIISTDIEKYCTEMSAKFLTGREPLENYEDFIAKLKKMGVDRLIELYQQAYDRWNAAQ